MEYDIKTVTAADYTCNFNLDEELLDYFEMQEFDEEIKKQPKLFVFKHWLRKDIEKVLSERPAISEEGDIKIANITFAFKYPGLI